MEKSSYITPNDNTKSHIRRVILYITRPEETKNCNFWVGMYKKGDLSPTDLYDFNNVEAVYNSAINQGINDSKAILISNTEKLPAQYFFFIPLEDLVKDETQAISSIKKTLEAINPKRAGIYFSRELLDSEPSLSLLRKVLHSCQQTGTKEFYLFSGEHGVNSILNAALEVKADLTDDVEVLVFH